jgi:hypothetical protein
MSARRRRPLWLYVVGMAYAAVAVHLAVTGWRLFT